MSGINLTGAIFNRSLSVDEIHDIQQADKLSDVLSVWDKITDFFCWSDKEGAKALLFELYHNKSFNLSEEEFGEKFKALKELAGASFTENFTVKEMNDFRIYTLTYTDDRFNKNVPNDDYGNDYGNDYDNEFMKDNGIRSLSWDFDLLSEVD